MEARDDQNLDASQAGKDQNEELKAAAITYNENDLAPILNALTTDERAEALIAMAKQQGVYIHKDKRLLEELAKYNVGEQIPEDLYKVISAILAFSYILQGKPPERYIDENDNIKVNTKA